MKLTRSGLNSTNRGNQPSARAFYPNRNQQLQLPHHQRQRSGELKASTSAWVHVEELLIAAAIHEGETIQPPLV